MSSEKYPLDFDLLNKGDSIPPHKLRDLTRADPGTPQYHFGVLKLRDQIRDEMESRGRPVNVAIVDGHLRILTDEEAVPYLAERFRAGQRLMARTLQNEAIVDTANLTEETKAKHERNLQIHGFKLAALRAVGRKLVAKQPTAITE